MGPHAAWQMGLLLTGVVSAVALITVLTLTRKSTKTPSQAGIAITLKLPQRELAMAVLSGCLLALYAGNFHAFLSLFPSYLFASGWSPGATASLMSALGWGPIVMAPVGGLIASRVGHTSLLIAICIFL